MKRISDRLMESKYKMSSTNRLYIHICFVICCRHVMKAGMNIQLR